MRFLSDVPSTKQMWKWGSYSAVLGSIHETETTSSHLLQQWGDLQTFPLQSLCLGLLLSIGDRRGKEKNKATAHLAFGPKTHTSLV